MNVILLSEKSWQSFRLLDYFDFIKGDQKDMSTLEAGELPLVSAKNSNNGYKAFVADNDKKIFSGHCLTLNNDGDGGAGIAYYQPTEFFLDTHVTALYPKIDLSKESLLFISRSITNQRDKFGHGYSLNNKRLNIFRVMLPVNDSGEPDFEYMENYVCANEGKILQRYNNYLAETPPPLRNLPLNKKIWQPFFISDLFRLETGKSKGLNHFEEDASGISYLGATNRNNAVLTFVRPVENLIQRGNCIAFIRNGEGSVGYSVYKREDFIATSDITCGYADFLNEFIGMFITTVADKVRGKYNFNYKRSDTRLKREKLMLPINDSGAPDFEYMEAFIKNIVAEKYRRYLEYINR